MKVFLARFASKPFLLGSALELFKNIFAAIRAIVFGFGVLSWPLNVVVDLYLGWI